MGPPPLSTQPQLSPHQREVVELSFQTKVFLEGPAGTGKTSAGVGRLLHLLASGIPTDSFLILVPQRTLGMPYIQAIMKPDLPAGGIVNVLTLAGLAQRMIELFWPLAAEPAGFARPEGQPVFLTLETAQYTMARIVRPLFTQGYFETITIERNRLYSQILDNLNKAALVGFPHTEIGRRLKAAWKGEISQARVYDDAQECAILFRQYCLAHNLLDFSLQIEIFIHHLWSNPCCRQHLLATFRNLIYDNVEEDPPIVHDLLDEWLPHLDSALLIYDQEGGYRQFLGSDPLTAHNLKQHCQFHRTFKGAYCPSPHLQSLVNPLRKAFNWRGVADPVLQEPAIESSNPEIPQAIPEPAILTVETCRYHPEMLDGVADQIAILVHEEGILPGEIAVLAPYLSDALRFSLGNRLSARGIQAISHRPSRALRAEAAAQCLLILAILAHPQWEVCPSKFDVAYALVKAIDGLDLVRGQLLADIVYQMKAGGPTLTSFDQLKSGVQERITFRLGGRFEHLRGWLQAYAADPVKELDHFLSRLFGEVLSQPGFGFHQDIEAGQVAGNLVESARKFRQVAAESFPLDGKPLSQEYIEMVQDGVVAAQYLHSWDAQSSEAVFLAPAYTFLMRNRPVEVQFWLDIGSHGWFERLNQPLTHPYVLSRHWLAGKIWTNVEEMAAAQDTLYRLVVGLLRRCRRRIYLGVSQLGEQGFEQQGILLRTLHRVLRQIQTPAE
jgi:hypothetical protein